MDNESKILKLKKIWGIVISIGIILSTSIAYAEEEFAIQNQIVVKIGEQKRITTSGEADIKWLSGNKQIATVDSKGIVTGIKNGKVYILARDLDTLEEYRCLVVVEKSLYEGSNAEDGTGDDEESSAEESSKEDSENNEPNTDLPENDKDEFKIPKELTIKPGEDKQLSIEGEKENIKWLSGNKEVATVNDEGIVSGIKQGKVWITARDMNTLKEYRCLVTVKESKPEELFEFSQTLSTKLVIADGWCSGEGFESFWKDDNVRLENGKLLLQITENEPSKEQKWLSGEIFVNDFYQYGMYEVSMKPIRSSGVVNGFFTYTGPGYGYSWEEIDIEFLGNDTSKVQFNYIVNGDASHKFLHSLGFDASESFHTYGFRWEKNYIAWYVDGKEVYRVTGQMPSNPAKIMANVWVTSLSSWAGVFEGKTPLTAEIEWIKYTPTD